MTEHETEQAELELEFIDEVKRTIECILDNGNMVTPDYVASMIGRVTPEGMDIIESLIEEVI